MRKIVDCERGKRTSLFLVSFSQISVLLLAVNLSIYLHPIKTKDFGQALHMNSVPWSGQDRFGSDRFGSVICIITGKSPFQELYLAYQIIPKNGIIIACTVTVQLPMHVLHDTCHGRAPSGNDQLPKVVLHNY